MMRTVLREIYPALDRSPTVLVRDCEGYGRVQQQDSY